MRTPYVRKHVSEADSVRIATKYNVQVPVNSPITILRAILKLVQQVVSQSTPPVVRFPNAVGPMTQREMQRILSLAPPEIETVQNLNSLWNAFNREKNLKDPVKALSATRQTLLAAIARSTQK